MDLGGQIAVVGIGVMGSAIARRLLDTGHRVIVFDIDEQRAAGLVRSGASLATSPGDATVHADIVVLSLNTAEIVEAVVFGPDGIATAGSEHKLLVDMSSIDPASTVEFAGRLHAQTGMRWTDNPLSGGAPAAESGTLTIMTGGSDDDVRRSAAMFADLATNRTLMGPVGAGQATKLINQVIVGNGFATLMECAELAVRGGVDPDLLPAALAGGRADSPILQEYFTKLAVRDYSPTGRIDNMLKDLAGAQDFARDVGVETPLLDRNVELHRWLVDQGHGGSDTAAMMEFHGPMPGAGAADVTVSEEAS